jgi:hypothetical protein
MSSAGFEPAIAASERPQTYALDREVTGTGSLRAYKYLSIYILNRVAN